MNSNHSIHWYNFFIKVILLIPRIPFICSYIYRALKLRNCSSISLGLILEQNARLYGNAKALLYDDNVISHHKLNSIVNRYCHYFKSFGIRKGEVVVVFIENGPEILYIVGGLSKLGAIASLINPNHRKEFTFP